MFVAALFIVAQTWKQPGYCSVGEWTNKLWYTPIMEYYLGSKKNELSGHGKPWRKPECILLSERSRSEKTMYCVSPVI